MDLTNKQSKLLSRLQLSNPSYNLNFEVMGAFAFPEAWVDMDKEHEFSYKVKFFDMEISHGKSIARVKTEEEMKAEEDTGKGKGKAK